MIHDVPLPLSKAEGSKAMAAMAVNHLPILHDALLKAVQLSLSHLLKGIPSEMTKCNQLAI